MRETLQRVGLVVLFAACFLLGNWAFKGSQAEPVLTTNADSVLTQLHLFHEILVKLNRHYVAPINSQELVLGAIDGMLSELDPHTYYFTPEELENFEDDTAGEFGGLGITVDAYSDTVTVVETIAHTPAWNAGILAGDRIVSVNAQDVVGMPSDEAISLMRGDVGSTVTLGIVRPGCPQPKTFHLRRGTIHVASVPYAFSLGDSLGYVRLRQFNLDAADELGRALRSLGGIRGLVFDLRANPGGLLEEAIDTASEFLGADQLVVSTRGRLPMYDQDYYTSGNGTQPNYPVVVLVDGNSASAAEIVAGALQDYDRALVMGQTSFGKGSVQQLFPLSEGGIKLTTSYYYIPSGRCIHKAENDELLRGREVTEEEQARIDQRNQAEYHTRGGRAVRGGGGIAPDVTVLPDTLNLLAVHMRIENLPFEYAIRLMGQQPHITSVTEATLADYAAYARRHLDAWDDAEWQEVKDWARREIAAPLVSQERGPAAAWQLRMQGDPVVRAAVAQLKRARTQEALIASVVVPAKR